MRLESAQRVGVRNDPATVTHNRGSDGAVGESSLLLIRGESIRAVEILVDDTSHALLAVAAIGLGAIVPERLSILNDKLEDVGLIE